MTLAKIFEHTSWSRFTNRLEAQCFNLASSTYQAGKPVVIGMQPDGRFSIFGRTLSRCMGLWANDQALWTTMLYQLRRLENVLGYGQAHDGHDCLYVPQVGYTTGDIHDSAVDEQGRVVFVNTLGSCLATTSEAHSFTPLWRPPFVSNLCAEESCRLNGLPMQDGKPRDNKTFTGLPLDDNLVKRGATARCQLAVIDLRTFDLVHWLQIEDIVEELYEVVVLPGVTRSMLLGFRSDEIRRTLSIADTQPLFSN